jgi:hypothetical protein
MDIFDFFQHFLDGDARGIGSLESILSSSVRRTSPIAPSAKMAENNAWREGQHRERPEEENSSVEDTMGSGYIGQRNWFLGIDSLFFGPQDLSNSPLRQDGGKQRLEKRAA